MNLVWKLLRQHISIGQFVGFSLANMLGVLIILFGFQFYNDVLPVFTGDDSFMKNNYIIINKNIGTASTLTGFETDEQIAFTVSMSVMPGA